MKNICVIGTGYVGLVTGTCFADLGNTVVCVDINEEKIAMLKAGKMPIYEPGLEEMVERNVRAGRLSFTTSYSEGLGDATFVFIAVGTPSGVDGEADLRYVRMAAEEIARTMTEPLIIINKSTVPVGTGDWVADIVSRTQPKPIDFAVVSNPEFLREGNALADFLNPDRVVLGSLSKEAAEKVAQLHLALRAPIVVTDLRTAEMIKYASNAFLATRISFINEIAAICEELGADVKEVAAGMGYDKRIGKYFLDAGLGYGGLAFPRTFWPWNTWLSSTAPTPPSSAPSWTSTATSGARLSIACARSWAGCKTRPSACWAWPSSPTPTTCARPRRSRSATCCKTRAPTSKAMTRCRCTSPHENSRR